jgi:hypothetical protein
MKHFEEIKGALLNDSALFYVSTGRDGNYSYKSKNYANAFLHVQTAVSGEPHDASR